MSVPRKTRCGWYQRTRIFSEFVSFDGAEEANHQARSDKELRMPNTNHVHKRRNGLLDRREHRMATTESNKVPMFFFFTIYLLLFGCVCVKLVPVGACFWETSPFRGHVSDWLTLWAVPKAFEVLE